jgi:hypothetical protein
MAQLLLTGTEIGSCSTLQEALNLVQGRLQDWASNSGAYNALLQEAFGVRSSETTNALQYSIRGSGLGIKLELLDAATLNGMNGAHASDAPQGGERIYLNAAWLQTATASEIEAVLLEEIGHAIDHRLNGAADSPGDEGEVFSARLRGLIPASSASTENDHRQINLNGTAVAVEAFQAHTGPGALSGTPLTRHTVAAATNSHQESRSPGQMRLSVSVSRTLGRKLKLLAHDREMTVSALLLELIKAETQKFEAIEA